MKQKSKSKSKSSPLIIKGNLTSIDIILRNGKRYKGVMHLQKTRKTDKLEGEVVSFKRNPSKMIFFESDSEELQFTQLACYKEKPFQFMLVAGNRYVIMPFDIAFRLKKGLEDYLDFVKSQHIER